MPLTIEALEAAQAFLSPKLDVTFWRFSPILEKIFDGNGIAREKMQGPRKDFRLLTNGPGGTTILTYGSELLDNVSRDQVILGNVGASRYMYHWIVYGKELAEINSDTDVENLIEQKPVTAYMDFAQDHVKQLLLGTGSAGIRGFLTFNGSTTYSSFDGSRTGVFSFAAPASQTSTVFGVTKRGGTGGLVDWYNQYGNISAMGDDGEAVLRETYYDCGAFHRKYAEPDLLIADKTSFYNYIRVRDDRVYLVDERKPETKDGSAKPGIPFLNGRLMFDTLMNVDDATLIAQNGIVYILNTKSWQIYTMGNDADMEGGGWFEKRKPFRIPHLDAWRFEIVMHAGMYTEALACNGVVTGGWTR